MSRWNGPYVEEKHRGDKGVMRITRDEKRREADERNTLTLPERRRKYRQHEKVVAERIASLPDVDVTLHGIFI